jgi:hypothetical protein
MTPVTDSLNKHLRIAKQIIANRYMGKPDGRNVVGVGIGHKLIEGVDTGIPCVRVYVNGKKPCPPVEPIHPGIPGIEIDIVEASIPPAAYGRPYPEGGYPNAKPGQPGSSIGPVVTGANVSELVSGTLGVVLLDNSNRPRRLVSCNHVLSRKGRVPMGSEIVSPALADDTQEGALRVARLLYAAPLVSFGVNKVDCAIAEVVAPELVDPRFPDGTIVNRFRPPVAGAEVIKFGKSTGKTSGRIVDVESDVRIEFDFGSLRFEDQVLIEGEYEPFAAAGDSGALVIQNSGWKKQDQPAGVALVIGPLGRFTVACPMPAVLESLRPHIPK